MQDAGHPFVNLHGEVWLQQCLGVLVGILSSSGIRRDVAAFLKEPVFLFQTRPEICHNGLDKI